MPRIEFENLHQKVAFIDWLSEKVGEEKAHRLDSMHDSSTICEIWLVDNDPLVISRDLLTESDEENMNDILISERHKKELKTAGVIFEEGSVLDDAVVAIGLSAGQVEASPGASGSGNFK